MKPAFPWKLYLGVFLSIALVALLPVLSVAIAGGIASLADCRLDEGNVHPCVILGADFGGLLYGMGVLGWLMLVTLPLGALAGFGWVLVWIGHFAWHKWRR